MGLLWVLCSHPLIYRHLAPRMPVAPQETLSGAEVKAVSDPSYPRSSWGGTEHLAGDVALHSATHLRLPVASCGQRVAWQGLGRPLTLSHG